MTTPRKCERIWVVEALRDGRVDGVERAKAARHLETCAECAREHAELERLACELRDATEHVDELHVRRMRPGVLHAAELARSAGGDARAPRARRTFWIAATAAALVLVVLGWRWRRVEVPVVATTSPPPSADAVVEAAQEGAVRWTRTTTSEAQQIILDDGTLRVRVRRPPGSKRVIVRVPDGELEDIGTVFFVTVVHGRTQRVGVDEGRVVVRLAGSSQFVLSAGESWERPEETASPASSVAHAPPVAAPSGIPRPVPTAVGRAPATSTSAAAGAGGASEEDEAYLRVIQLTRAGRRDEARAAALEYLRRFPDGFRREEVGRVAR